jgi:hypothetical protein
MQTFTRLNPLTRLCTQPSGNVELTFLGYPFESFSRVLDPVLAIVAISRKQPDDLIGAAGGRPCDIAGRKIDSLSNVVFMLQRHLHHAKTSIVPTCPAAIDWKAPQRSSTPPVFLASYISTYQIRRICRFFSAITAYLKEFGELADGRLALSRRGANSDRFRPILPGFTGNRRQFPRRPTEGPTGPTLTRLELAPHAEGGVPPHRIQAVCGSLPSGLA